MINVTMDGSVIRIRPVGRLDDQMVATITQLLDCARLAGTDAQLDVGGLDASDRPTARHLTMVRPVPAA